MSTPQTQRNYLSSKGLDAYASFKESVLDEKVLSRQSINIRPSVQSKGLSGEPNARLEKEG